MTNRFKAFTLSVAAAFVLVFAIGATAAEEADQEPVKKAEKRPKRTQRPVQQGVVARVVDRVVPGGAPIYQRAAENPAVQPNYPSETKYQNPLLRPLELGDSEALRQARQWLDNPALPEQRGSRENAPIPRGPSTPIFTGRAYLPTQVDDARQVVSVYDSVPTGMVLEGAASDLGRIDDVQYDPILNAFVLDERAVYFSPVAPQSLAVLCRAIAKDRRNRVGVALGPVQIAYGALPHDSQVAIDLKLADNFLGNIAFAQTNWLPPNYPLANGFMPQSDPTTDNTAVMFNMTGYRFDVADELVRVAGARFEVRLLPISSQPAPNGGALPDYDAIERGALSREFEANAQHIADEIEYYRREGYVDRAIRYGEAAALIRALKNEQIDLEELAEIIEQSTGVDRLVVGPALPAMQAPIDQLFAAWITLDAQSYMDQWSRSAVQISFRSTGETRRENFEEIRAVRERLFRMLSAPKVGNVTIYVGFNSGVGYFRNWYTLTHQDANGTAQPRSGCELYKVRNEGGRWVIFENHQYRTC